MNHLSDDQPGICSHEPGLRLLAQIIARCVLKEEGTCLVCTQGSADFADAAELEPVTLVAPSATPRSMREEESDGSLLVQ